jgi:hypothetical protein
MRGIKMNENYNLIWQRIAAFLGTVLLTIFICFKLTDPGFTWIAFLYWIHLAFIMIHETEEYIFPGGFPKFINTETILGKNPPEIDSPATPAYTLFVNMSIWIWAILGGLTANILPWIGMGLVFFQLLINGIQHTAIFQVKKTGYNPGFITTWLILNPFCVVTIFYAFKFNILTSMDWILAAIVGIGYIGILLTNTMRLRKKKA